MATNGNGVHQEQYGAAPAEAPAATDSSATAASESSASASNSVDEVGWYFVKQYYTTLSKNTAKLHLFYNKQSQFVQGPEAELVDVSVGRQTIQEAIKRLDFQDCKVRVANVDAQASYNNIVIQVIGEISNKGAEPKKFVQTFVLAQQPAGYFLLNDIMRYINEGEEDRVDLNAEEAAPAATVAAAEPEVPEAPQEFDAKAEPEKPKSEDAAKTSSRAPEALDAQAVDKKLEEVGSGAKASSTTSAVETPAEPVVAAPEAPSKPEVAEPAPEPEKALPEAAEAQVSKAEVPKEPSPTPAPARAPAPEPEKPKEPPKPMSWASRVAATAPKPVVPLPAKAAASPAQSAQPAQPRPAAAPAAAQPVVTPVPAGKEAKETKEESEWRLADSKRQSRQHSVAPPEKEGTLAYVKFVTDKVKDDELRSALSSHGELVYFDVNRSKNCAFVEYATPAACLSVIKSSPITIAGDSIVIEHRRPKAGAYGGANYNQTRGPVPGRGRGGFEGGRSGSQGGGRGNFTNNNNRGRGGARGRGGSQAPNP